MKNKLHIFLRVWIGIFIVLGLLYGCKNDNNHRSRSKSNNTESVSSSSKNLENKKDKKVYSEESKTITIGSIARIGPKKPNEVGPYFYKYIDLDKGEITNKENRDIEITLSPRDNKITLRFYDNNKGVRLEKKSQDFGNFLTAFNSSEKISNSILETLPTDYYGVKTKEGRYTCFSFRSMKITTIDADLSNLAFTLDYITWDH